MPRPAHALPAAALALAALAAGAAGQEPPPAPAPPAPPVAPPSHPSLATGWARALVPGEVLRTAPAATAPPTGPVASPGIAGPARALARDAGGAVWVRVAFPDAVAGWAPGAALVVRDPLGRTLFAAGTRAPLSIASVTKVATVSAALRREALPLRAVAAILGPSDNARAQALSNRLGDGSRVLGARRAVVEAAALGAGWRLVDGSGLSPANRASAGEVADLLLALRDEPRFPTLFRAMPVAARTGTLAHRMAGTAAVGRVRAKTGTLFDTPASALAGYVWPAGGGLSPRRAMVVVVLSNGVPPRRARPLQDLMAATLAAPGALTRG